VRVIEHGTLMDDDTARFVADRGAYVVATMVPIYVRAEQGRLLGLPSHIQEKVEFVFGKILPGLESMQRAGVKIGFGTDLVGETYVHQCREFALRKQVFSPLEILRQATSTNAALLQHEGKLGCIRPEAHADLLVVDGDPLKDIDLVAASGKHLRLIMRAGELIRNELA
jgi:imidazolonepropionase-like amidohydrolase